MAGQETSSSPRFSWRIEWRYLKELWTEARNRWWSAKGKHLWGQGLSGVGTLGLERWLGADPAWWHPVAAALAGFVGFALIVFIFLLAITPAQIHQKAKDDLDRAAGRLSEEELKSSQAERINLYKEILLVVSRWRDLATVVEHKPAGPASQEHLQTLKVQVDHVSELVNRSDPWWSKKYDIEVRQIRDILLPEASPQAAANDLRSPVGRLAVIAGEDRQWHLGLGPRNDKGNEH